MRISTNQMQLNGVSAMLEQSSKLSQTQQQLASGKKFLSPSEDPIATSKVLNLEQSMNITNQYQQNSDIARTRLNNEETVLQSLTSVLDRVRELAVQGNNSTYTNVDRLMFASEIRQRLEDVLTLSNTKDASGEFLFSGYQGNVQPFSVDAVGNYIYSGDDGQRYLQIGPTRQVAVGDNGTDVFRQIRNGNGTFYTSGSSANTGNGLIDPGSVVDASLIDGDSYTLVFPAATSATNSLVFGDNIGTNDDLTYTLKIDGNTVYSVAESGTPVNTLDGLASVINDDVATTGVRAYVANNTLYLARTTPSSTPIVIDESLTGMSDGDLDTATGYFGSTLTGVTTPNANVTINNGDGSVYFVQDSLGNIETNGNYVDGAQITVNGMLTSITGTPRNNDVFTISPSQNQDLFTTIQNLAVALETGAHDDASLAQLNNNISATLSNMDQSMENIRIIRAKVGSRLSAIDAQENLNEDYSLHIKETLSNLQDLDFTEAISRLNLQLVGLQAAQQSYMQIQGLSLFNYL
ncbi:MAG: flagellar hook-associated protein FlgL [Gammaproteobacteria bacterium]